MSGQSDTGRLQSLLLKHPREAFRSQQAIARQWSALNYLGEPDLERAMREYDGLVDALAGTGATLQFLDADPRTGLDSLYVRDAAVTCDRGVILCRMNKAARRHEPDAMGRALQDCSEALPILGAIQGEGRLEGGDVAWVSPRCLAVGRSRRSNREGIRQLRDLLADGIDELLEVELPDAEVAGDCFHLMSIFSPLADDLALVFAPLLPNAFRDALLERGMRLVEVPREEFDSLGCNVLALAPGQVIAVAGNPITRRSMERHGVEVISIQAREICHMGAGGPTCLTRPLRRLMNGAS